MTIDEKTMVSYHTPETRKQSKQWIPKGQPDNIDDHGVFRLVGAHLYAHRPQGRRHYHHLHHQGSVQVHGAFQEEEAHYGSAAVTATMGQRVSPYSHQREGVDGSEGDPG